MLNQDARPFDDSKKDWINQLDSCIENVQNKIPVRVGLYCADQ